MNQAIERCRDTTRRKPNKGSEAANAVISILKNGPKKSKNSSPRIKVIQNFICTMDPDALIEYPKSQYKKFIKDVVTGTLERSDLIEEQIKSLLVNDINLAKTDKLLKIILFAAIFELMFKHNTPKKILANI